MAFPQIYSIAPVPSHDRNGKPHDVIFTNIAISRGGLVISRILLLCSIAPVLLIYSIAPFPSRCSLRLRASAASAITRPIVPVCGAVGSHGARGWQSSLRKRDARPTDALREIPNSYRINSMTETKLNTAVTKDAPNKKQTSQSRKCSPPAQ